MALSPKTLQLTEGDTAVITATSVPAGTPVTWGTSDGAVATVANGTVSAVAAGAATITATIEVEGVTYSDTCTVTVEAVPVSNVVFDLTALGNWSNPDLWNKQLYQETNRGTYIAYDTDSGELIGVYNPDGTTTTLYADIAPNTGDFVYDDSYNYYLEVEYTNGAGIYQFTHAGASSSIFVFDSTIAEFVPNTNDSATALIPLALYNETHTRLITIQIRKGDTVDADTPLRFKARIIREPK